MKNCLYDKALHATREECHCSPPFYRDVHVHSTSEGWNDFHLYRKGAFS